MSTPDDWNEAMEWWKSQSDCVQGLIRKVATEKVHSFQGDGYGISSSDINHTVCTQTSSSIRSTVKKMVCL